MLLTVWRLLAGDLSEGGGAAEIISGALAEPGALAHTLREAPTLVDRGEQKQAVSPPALCSRFRLFGTFVAREVRCCRCCGGPARPYEV